MPHPIGCPCQFCKDEESLRRRIARKRLPPHAAMSPADQATAALDHLLRFMGLAKAGCDHSHLLNAMPVVRADLSKDEVVMIDAAGKYVIAMLCKLQIKLAEDTKEKT